MVQIVKSYLEVEAPSEAPWQVNPNFSRIPDGSSDIMYIKSPVKPKFFVQSSNFNDKTPQSALREEYMAGNKSKVVALVALPFDDTQDQIGTWQDALLEYAKEHVATKRVAVGQSSKARKPVSLTLEANPIVKYDTTGEARIKCFIAPDVLSDLRDSVNLKLGLDASAENLFEYPSGVYKVMVEPRGVWKNASGYGMTMAVIKMRLHEVTDDQTSNRRIASLEFPDSDADE